MKHRWGYLLGWGLSVGMGLGSGTIAQPHEPSSLVSSPIRPLVQCPADLEALILPLLRDLPHYANRVSQRAYPRRLTPDIPGYVLLASLPEVEPLSLGPGSYEPVDTSDPPQVFFTTLERQYVRGQAVLLQHHHWLFLTQTRRGWRLVLMVSAIAQTESHQPPTPPRDSSQGVVAQAVRLWLRDCQAGSVELHRVQ